MLSKRYKSTEVDRRTWLHVPSGTHWSTSSDTHQVVEIQIETSTNMYTPNVTHEPEVNTPENPDRTTNPTIVDHDEARSAIELQINRI